MAKTKALPVITPAAAARHLLKLREAETSFLGFVKACYPDYILQPFQLELIDALDRLEKGTLTNEWGKPVRRLLINMPPRHGKSFLATQCFPVYYMARKATREVMSTSYNAELAKTFGRQVRDLAREAVVAQAFPDFKLSDENRAVDHWKTTAGGVYYGIGMGGTTTGRGANLLIVDDPLKSRVEADSAHERESKWSYYISALQLRKQPERDGTPAIEIMILTRWHPDDPAGRLMETQEWKDGDWMHIKFAAIRKIKTEVKVHRRALPPEHPMYLASTAGVPSNKHHVYEEKETSLWPERFPLEEILRLRSKNVREFEALYQQEPYVAGGNLIKSSWLQKYDPATDLPPRFSSIVIGCDTAFKAKEQSDYSVFTIAGLCPLGNIYVLDVIRGKWEFPDLKRKAVLANVEWRGRGLRGCYIEDKASGQSLIQELKKESGIAVIAWKMGGDKVSRANAVTPMIEGGRVYVPTKAPWLDAWLTELAQFPGSTHDDQVDSLVICLDVLSQTRIYDDNLLNAPINQVSTYEGQFGQTPEQLSKLFSDNSTERWLNNWGELET